MSDDNFFPPDFLKSIQDSLIDYEGSNSVTISLINISSERNNFMEFFLHHTTPNAMIFLAELFGLNPHKELLENNFVEKYSNICSQYSRVFYDFFGGMEHVYKFLCEKKLLTQFIEACMYDTENYFIKDNLIVFIE